MVPPDIPTAPSSTLWATASKEWVIPEKPKPGRKPKKDSAIPTSYPSETDSTDLKGRRVQNRAAQRAFRERKQSQLSDLQARLQQYEQGEIERNVALQATAKKLKEENEALKGDNTRLRKEISALRSQLEDKKRARDDDLEALCGQAQKKRPKYDTALVGMVSRPASPSSIVSSPSPVSPPPDYPKRSTCLSSSIGSAVSHPLDGFVDCGFCTEDGPCVCRELAMQESVYDMSTTESSGIRNDEDKIALEAEEGSSNANPSILDNLPSFQPAVPLKKRIGPKSATVFKTYEAAPACSGDPNNCRACADDPFGRAFCSALGDVVATSSRCSNCPVGGCDNAGECEGLAARNPELVPRADAWRRLKSHPNAAFADLRLLAEVVARKTACSGPTIDLELADSDKSLDQGNQDSNHALSESNDVSPYHPNAEHPYSDAPCLVPQEVLIRCGRDRVFDVQAEGVREALRLLDSRCARAIQAMDK